MTLTTEKQVEYLVVDTTAFIQNAPLQNVASNIITCKEVVNEITSKRQLRRLVVLPYDLIIKDVFPENINIITEFSKKTGDYPSLSATDIKVMALTYQLEKEKVGTEHLRKEPIMQRVVNYTTKSTEKEVHPDVTGFYLPGVTKNIVEDASPSHDDDDDDDENNEPQKFDEIDQELSKKFENLDVETTDLLPEDDVLVTVNNESSQEQEEDEYNSLSESEDETGWITPSNISAVKKQVDTDLIKNEKVKVACMTTDFAMQNVLKQMNLNISALDGRIIKQLRTFILRCYTCFKTTSIMTKKFCPKCGNNTLKRVAVSLDENGKMQLHINLKHPLTPRGKKFSLPTIKGGKHSNNPILVEDQPIPHQRPSRLARTKNNPLDDDYIAGYSPFVMRDVNSKSAQLCIRPGDEIKHWMRKNPNEAKKRNRRRK